jgi:hypothetical protein
MKRTAIILALILAFPVFGTLIAASENGSRELAPSKPAQRVHHADGEPGDAPDVKIVYHMVYDALLRNLEDPDAFKGPEMADPVKDSIKVGKVKVACWRVDYTVRVRDGSNAMRQESGSVWMKDGDVLAGGPAGGM